MRCKSVLKQLNAFSDGKIPSDLRRKVQAHLKECAGCRSAMSRVDPLAGLLPFTKAPQLQVGFAGRVMAAARQRKSMVSNAAWNPLRWWQRASAPMHIAAAATLLIGLAIGLMMGWTTAKSSGRPPVAERSDLLGTYQLDFLSEAPQGSLANTYLTFVMVDSE